MKKLLTLLLSLTFLLILCPIGASASNLTISTVSVSNIKLPEPGTAVADYVGTTECPTGQNYSVQNKRCYWSNESKTEMYDTNTFSFGAVYYYSIVLKTMGNYVFDSGVKLSITGGIVDPGMQVILGEGGSTVTFKNAYKVTCGTGQTQSINSIVLSKDTFYYNGKIQKPKLTVLDNTGTEIDASNYDVSYSNTPKKVGNYTVTVESKGMATGSASAGFKICPSVPRNVRVTGMSGAVKVSWKKPKSGKPEGYNVFVYSDPSCKEVVTSANISETHKTLGGLKSGRTYYVRVDCYVRGDGYLVSKQSEKKSVTVR